MRPFDPPPSLRSPHLQTVLGRTVVKLGRGRVPEVDAESTVLECRDGVKLKAMVARVPTEAPLVILIHGWLGNSKSWYVARTAHVLSTAGFRVACLLLRDHGGTASYNLEMFNSARLGEVVEACNGLIERTGAASAGILGFSLGGNFALRLASDASVDPRLTACLAISPVIDPTATVHAIDTGWQIYRKWFVDQWRRELRKKQAAFPDEYRDLDGAMRLSTVSAITDYIVDRHLPYRDAADYYARYDLRGDALARLRIDTRIIAAVDDMVIPGTAYAEVSHSDQLHLDLFDHGGHCGFIEDWRLNAYPDAASADYFQTRLGGA